MDSLSNRPSQSFSPTPPSVSTSNVASGGGTSPLPSLIKDILEALGLGQSPANQGGGKAAIKGFESTLSTSSIYNAFMGGTNGITARTDNLNKTIMFGIAIQKVQQLGQNITDALTTKAADVFGLNPDGTINLNSTNTFDPANVQVTMTIKGVSATVPINTAINAYNDALTGLQNLYEGTIYPTAKANNPDAMLPKTLNLPEPLPTMEDCDWGVTAFQNYIITFQSNISQLLSVSKNVSLGISQQQQKLNNAQQGLSATLKILMAMVMTLLNNMS